MYLSVVRRAHRVPKIAAAAAAAQHARPLSIKGMPDTVERRAPGEIKIDDIIPPARWRRDSDLEGYDPLGGRRVGGEGISEREANRPRQGDDIKGMDDVPGSEVQHPEPGKQSP